MGIIQQASGTFSGGSPFSVALPAASVGTSRVVLFVVGNTTISTPSGFTLRASQVNYMGHYLFDIAGGGTSYTVTPGSSSGSAGMWYIGEVENGVYDASVGANDPGYATTYASPIFTPTAGERALFQCFGSLDDGTVTATADSWTGGYVEVADASVAAADRPQGAVATQIVTANGSTSYPTTVTFSKPRIGRSAISASYITSTSSAGPINTARVGTAQVNGYRLGTSTPTRIYMGTTLIFGNP